MARGCMIGAVLVGMVFGLCGCGGGEPAPDAQSSTSPGKKKPKAVTAETPAKPVEDDLKPLTLGPSESTGAPAAADSGQGKPSEKAQESVVETLKPFNTLLGEWEGKTRKQFEGFARVDSVKWLWDFKTDRKQPSVTFQSDKSPYFLNGWITYVPEKEVFRLTTESPEKERRVYEGTWTDGGEPKQESDGKKLQWSFKMKFTQVEPAEGDQYQVELGLQENNRYHLTLAKRPQTAKQFVQLDVVGTQRKNTSFAVVDSDNPGPKCIVSGGLGTTSVSYEGKTYYVCCSGCAAAFAEDPVRWITKAAKMDAEKKKDE